MHVELYERIWMWAATGLIALFLGAILATAAQAIHAPSHVETVDPTALGTHPEFSDPAVAPQADGRIVVSVVATMFAFRPDPIEVPANQPVTFRVTSDDVVHGFDVVGTNVNVMAIPGYVSEVTTTFERPGEYLITCHEYCGLYHHQMVGKVIVK